MTDALRYDGKVALITGAGNGLGRAHALLLARRGARVVVNDLGGSATGGGHSSAAADRVVAEIKEAGGEAVANYDSVEDGGKIVQSALDHFGRIDIVVNNAGILRDSSFLKMTDGDWDLIQRVHVNGAYKVTHAAWPHLRDQKYGRILFTASAAGLYGNFGQANYSTAKLGLVGLGFTLAAEGRKYNIGVNTIAPIAGSRLTETILPKELIDALRPEYVSPLVAWLAHEQCEETGGIFEVGGGFFAKLRWERTAGQMFRIGRDITPELLRTHWSTVVDFSKTTHPEDVTRALQPVMDNVNAGASKGGNEFIDVDLALGYEFPPISTRYDERDLSLYALGVGAAADPLDDLDLRHVYEMHGQGFTALPTYAVIPALTGVMNAFRDGQSAPGLNYGLDRLLHGEQYTELRRPLPPKAKLSHRTWVKDIFDKGKNALVVMAIESTDETGEVLAYNELGAVIRGAGGWGGDRGPSSDINTPPDRAPDFVRSEKIGANQALLYRLSGDWNPLHVDPGFATAFGFPRPILHGLCTFGYAARHALRALEIDPRKFKSIKVRFADSVFPGETLVTEIWRESPTRAILRAKVLERDKVVLSNAAIEFYTEIPNTAPKAKAQVQAAATAAAPAIKAVPNSADVFTAIGQFLQKQPELAAKAATVFQFKLSAPESVWTIDCKANKVAQGELAAPECTLELSDADFMDMCTGKADAQQLYMGGKLKIGGNLMASMKLNFLKKLDPELVLANMRARVGAGAGEPAAAPTPAADTGPNSADVFIAIRDHIERNPELAAKIQTVFAFKLKEPESAWTIDLKAGKGAVHEGLQGSADCTLELKDSDWMAMTSGKADPQQLYMGGQLKIAGNVMASTKLGFLKKIDMNAAKAAIAAHRGQVSGASKPAQASQPAPTKTAQAPLIADRLVRKLADSKHDAPLTLALHVKDPASEWSITLGPQGGHIVAGPGDKPSATLTIADDDLLALAQGKTSAQQLFQRGKLRVDGDVQAAHYLGLIEGSL
ncbi:MAG: SDR family NAD(P)-dependent oxidoreductase [Nannocystis sp.]|uniref:peroxisomal multifunctional enzyme type 2 n=1 Tax=Nannocystis sp. TaxID=1962667 RepID=UPI002426F6B1|nr:peroxisomal multifunctional enzyme type 2 [Nannocystis sp.]MBK9757622.1 SDR family NAD(P)-dependent oxidoreductase [Nannocystis sp.]